MLSITSTCEVSLVLFTLSRGFVGTNKSNPSAEFSLLGTRREILVKNGSAEADIYCEELKQTVFLRGKKNPHNLDWEHLFCEGLLKHQLREREADVNCYQMLSHLYLKQ